MRTNESDGEAIAEQIALEIVIEIDGMPVRRSASGVLLLDGAPVLARRDGVVYATVEPEARRRPVFVDDSGHRARAFRMLALPLVWVAAIGAGLFVAALVGLGH
jgi:hypothetical protein